LEGSEPQIGVFLCFEEPTKPMDGTTYPRLQILTIQQILDGKQPE
jgi:hypothetical protein